MSHWQRTPEQRAAAWELLASLDLEVALVQEAVPPPHTHAVYRAGGIGGRRQWGSAVVSFDGELREIDRIKSPHGGGQELDLVQTFPGSVAIGQPAGAEPVVFVSAYGVMEGGYAVTTMHRVLSDLTPLLDKEIGKRLIIGGDFNCSTQLGGHDRARHRNLFDRFATLGLVDLLAQTTDSRAPLEGCPCSDDPCRHVQTLRHARSRTPWHNDYLFATPPLAERLRDCQPLAGPNQWALSDHCPVIAEFA
jgi:endonuclease/exonuclease/phosphatase family metal-dependent hydrolase